MHAFKIMFKFICSVIMLVAKVMAFTTTSINKFRTNDSMSHTNTITPLSVAVYQPDDMGTYTVMDESSANNIFDSFNNNYETDLDEGIFENIALQLQYDDSSITSTLARLASRYSPAGYDIDITNINEVRLQKLDSNSISIETIICEANECAALLVPITFAEECVLDDELRECISRNINTLDIEGYSLGEEKDRIFEEEKEALKAFDVLQSFDVDELKTGLSTLPDWWESPTRTEDISECELIEELLNESDFQSVLRSLASYMLPSERRLGAVSVKLVSRRGMLLKVELRQGNTIDVPVKYLHTGHDESRSIREQVLLVVSSIRTPLHE